MSSNCDQKYSYFAPGPGKLPDEVLRSVQGDIVEYNSSHVSVLELSHRSKDFDAILNETERLVRELLPVPDNYKVLFMQGGGNGQFAAVPLNLIDKTGEADYIVTGAWSEKAVKEASKYGKANRVFPVLEKGSKMGLPARDQWTFNPNASYVYYCDNETIEGLEFPDIPDTPFPDVPLVCDMSSNFFSRPFDVTKFGLIYGGAQKNIGCAGVTVVIVREDLLKNISKLCPAVLSYEVMAKNRSLYNTPPTFSIHVLGRVLAWIEKQGGVAAMQKLANEKSQMVYDVVDNSNGFYTNPLQVEYRSRMNAIVNLRKINEEDLEAKFIAEATDQGLLSLKGHRSVGGIRASLYNAVSVEDVKRLVQFMVEFQDNNGKGC